MPGRARSQDSAQFPAGAQSLLRSMNARAVLELIHRGPAPALTARFRTARY